MSKRLLLVIAVLLLGIFVLGACKSQTATEAPPTQPPATATTKPADTPVPVAKAGLSADMPLNMLFVPSGDTQAILAGAEKLDAALAQKGIYTKSAVSTSYAAAIEALCSGQADIAWLATLSYVLAHDKCGVEVLLGSVRRGSTTYNGQILVNVDSGITDIAGLKGKKFAFTDPASTSGYLYPVALMLENGVDPAKDLAESVFAGGHTAAAIAVYQGSVDAAATFIDARSSLTERFPDIMEKTQVIATTADIPNDTISISPTLDPEVVAAFKTAMVDYIGTDEGKQVVFEIYEWDGVAEMDDSVFEPIRQVAVGLGIELQNWKGVSTKYQVGQVTDVGGIDDKSFNQTAWKGVQDAMAALQVEGVYLESQQQTDYEKNLNEFIAQKKDLIITVGFLLADATKAAAEANPDVKFAIIDSGTSAPNVKGLLFDTSQPSFLAGYLAAGVSESGIVCTYGGINIPPVTDFMVGFTNGVGYYNQVKGAEVQVLGWDNVKQDGAFTGNFESTDDGRRFAENFFDEGCDVILPVAGPVGLGSAAAAQERGLKIIGVDTDQFVSSPEFGDVWLTSVQKNMDKSVYDTIVSLTRGTLSLGNDYLGTLANGGVGLAPFHNFDASVPQALKDELVAVTDLIKAGKINTRTGEIAKVYTVGEVTDVGGIDDKSFNQTAWKGVEDAKTAFGIDGVYLESQQQTDYEKNLNEFIAQKKDLIITVGFLLADATKAAAEANPDAKFAIIDSASSAPNIKGLLFDVAQPSYLAGYLAAGMSESGVVCTYGGINIPPVVEFMIGFQNGVEYYNKQNGADVQLLGWDNVTNDGAFTGNFESTDDGRRFAENFFDEGCDVIFPVAGPVGLGSAAAAKERGLMMIGVDSDQYVSAPEFGSVFLSSVLKNMDKSVYDTIGAMIDGSLTLGDNYLGTLANGGVGLGSFHDFDSKVSQELKDQLAQVTQDIIDGKIDPKAVAP